jgi:hypothetical protein
MTGIVNYTNQSTQLASVEANDVSEESGLSTVWIKVGKTLKSCKEKDRLYLQSWVETQHWFYVFSKTEIASMDPGVPIFEIKGNKGSWAKASWLLRDGEIQGVKVSSFFFLRVLDALTMHEYNRYLRFLVPKRPI